MSVLSDRRLRAALAQGVVKITPSPADENIGPASIDLTLDTLFRFPRAQARVIDLGSPRPELWEMLDDFAGPTTSFCDGIVLDPGECVLGETVERIEVPDHLLGRVDGRSILGRFFLHVHVTAMHMHPGWSGKLVLEMINSGPTRLLLRPGMRICAVFFEELTGPADRPYGILSSFPATSLEIQ